jgi:hypothetical protein
MDHNQEVMKTKLGSSNQLRFFDIYTYDKNNCLNVWMIGCQWNVRSLLRGVQRHVHLWQSFLLTNIILNLMGASTSYGVLVALKRAPNSTLELKHQVVWWGWQQQYTKQHCFSWKHWYPWHWTSSNVLHDNHFVWGWGDTKDGGYNGRPFNTNYNSPTYFWNQLDISVQSWILACSYAQASWPFSKFNHQ